MELILKVFFFGFFKCTLKIVRVVVFFSNSSLFYEGLLWKNGSTILHQPNV